MWAGQAHVVAPNAKAGVQAGEIVLITETGIETVHTIPRGFARV